MAEEQFTQGQNRSDGGRCDLSELRQSQCVLRSVSKSRVWYLVFSVADRCVRRLYALSACHDSGYCFLEHRIGDPAETKQAGKAVYPDAVHHLRNKF